MERKKILIADDEPFNVRALSFILKREGYVVECAADGEEALKKFEEFWPQLVFLDLMMPKKNGYEVTKILRNDPRYCEISPYVIILTCKGDDAACRKGYLEGADEYITKPFSPREILTKVRNVFSSRTALSSKAR